MAKKSYKIKSSEASIVEEPLSLYIPQSSISSFINSARQGLSKSFLDFLSAKLLLSFAELAAIFHVSERTLQRISAKDKLSSDISEKSLLIDSLYKKGIDVFGSFDDFNTWIRNPNPVFENKAPISFLDTSFGFQLIFTELGRIENGIFA